MYANKGFYVKRALLSQVIWSQDWLATLASSLFPGRPPHTMTARALAAAAGDVSVLAKLTVAVEGGLLTLSVPAPVHQAAQSITASGCQCPSLSWTSEQA